VPVARLMSRGFTCAQSLCSAARSPRNCFSSRRRVIHLVDTKQTKTIGEHHVCAVLARWSWAPALTRDGLERTDILAVHGDADRPMIEVQVKSSRGRGAHCSWPLGTKLQQPAASDREWFVLVAVDLEIGTPLRSFVAPRDHVAAAAWISHMDWLTDPTVVPGQRNAPVDRSRVLLPVFTGYEDRWDLLTSPTPEVCVRLPTHYRALALDPRRRAPSAPPMGNSPTRLVSGASAWGRGGGGDDITFGVRLTLERSVL
jgi:hypothetical protein